MLLYVVDCGDCVIGSGLIVVVFGLVEAVVRCVEVGNEEVEEEEEV